MNQHYFLKIGGVLLLVFLAFAPKQSFAQCSATPVVEAVRNGDFEAGYLTSNGAGKHNFTANGPFDFGSDLTFVGNFTSPSCVWSIANMYATAKAEPGMTCTASPRQAYAGTDYINVNFNDHTPGLAGNGFAFVADFEGFGGASSYGAPGLPAAWRQNVNIYANQKYYFSAWFANYNRDATLGGYNNPDLNFVVIPINAGGTLVMAERQVLGTATPTGQMSWQQFYGTWTPITATYTRVALFIEVQQATGTFINDILIDDISFINGCNNLTGSLPASIQPNLGPSFSLCLTNGTATLDANVSQTASTRFWWYSGTATPQTIEQSNTTNETFTITTPGTYRVCLQDASFPAGCSASSTIVVTNTMPPVTLSNQAICTAATATLTASLTGTGLTYNWYKRPGGVANPGNVSSLTTSVTGVYGVQVTSPVAGCGTVTSNDATVTSNIATPTLTSANCSGSPITFGVSATGGAGTGYNWWTASSGGTLKGTGASTTLSYATMPSPAVIYVENYNSTTIKTDGAATNTNNAGADVRNNTAFDVLQDFTLISVSVKTAFCGSNFQIQLYKNGVLQQTSAAQTCASFSAGGVVNLNWNLTIGTGYELRTTGGAWINYNASTTTINTSIATIYSNPYGVGPFYNWVTAAGSPCMRTPLTLDCTLPVRFLDLNARVSGDDVVLNWLIVEDEDRSAYIVERSEGSTQHFEKIAEVPTGALTGGIAEYSFLDHEVAAGVVYYYRIGKRPEEGGMDYSSVAAVELSAGSTLISAAPNPYSNATVVSNTQASAVTVVITDLQGRVLSTTTLDANEVREMSPGLSPGLYILSAQNASGKAQVLRLVKSE